MNANSTGSAQNATIVTTPSTEIEPDEEDVVIPEEDEEKE